MLVFPGLLYWSYIMKQSWSFNFFLSPSLVNLHRHLRSGITSFKMVSVYLQPQSSTCPLPPSDICLEPRTLTVPARTPRPSLRPGRTDSPRKVYGGLGRMCLVLCHAKVEMRNAGYKLCECLLRFNKPAPFFRRIKPLVSAFFYGTCSTILPI